MSIAIIILIIIFVSLYILEPRIETTEEGYVLLFYNKSKGKRDYIFLYKKN